ncbi:sialidase family protein [Streptomyces sp. NPDC051211]|uniref:sialidase family protein n=1 Tax=Streptomyces sp. NPDC051211 TaxID=3154643 RepID=UPI00344B3094
MSSQQSAVRFRWETPVWVAVVALAVIAVVTVLLLPGGGGGQADPRPKGPGPESVVSTPFKAFTDGYDCYRIPTLVTTKQGALLALAEARLDGCGDVGDIDLVLKRSYDNGRSWEPMQVLRGGGRGNRDGYGNPVPVIDADSGLISVMYAFNTWTTEPNPKYRKGAKDSKEPKEIRVRGPRALHLMHSRDEGRTWTDGHNPQPQLIKEDWEWLSVGPGHGIQLARTDMRPGRLVIAGEHRDSRGWAGAQLYYSDDAGMSWKLGAQWEAEADAAAPTEPTLAQLTDGSLYVNARSTRTCDVDRQRLAARIQDVAAPFFPDPGFRPVTDIVAPPVSGSLLQLPKDRLLFSAPSRPGSKFTDRWRLAVRTSSDGGKTWSTTGTVIKAERSGYSDLTLLPSGEVGMLYETATGSPHGYVNFTAFTPDALDAGSEDLTRPGEAGSDATAESTAGTPAPCG